MMKLSLEVELKSSYSYPQNGTLKPIDFILDLNLKTFKKSNFQVKPVYISACFQHYEEH